MQNMPVSTTVSLVIESRLVSLAELSAILASTPGEGSKDVSRGERKALWKMHFGELRHPGELTQQIESASIWLENHLNKIRGELPKDCRIYAMVGLCFSTVTGTIAIPAEMLRRLSSYVTEVEITYYPTRSKHKASAPPP